MRSKQFGFRVALLVMLLGVGISLPVFAGSAVIGSVAGSTNATISGQPAIQGTTLLSGDMLEVRDGVAVVDLGKASRLVFGRDAMASFLRDTNEVTVLLSKGNVSLYYPGDAVPVRVKAGDVSVIPATGFKTLGEVATLNDSVIVTAKEGSLQVESNGKTVAVVKGKTITVPAKTAGTPQAGATGAAAGAAHVSTATAIQATTLAATGVSVGTSSVALKNAGNAKDSANAATTAANSANTTASQAVTAANTAATNATAATTAAQAAGANATNVGCALNVVAAKLGSASPFTPPPGTTCK